MPPLPATTPLTPADLRAQAGMVCVALSGPEMLLHAEAAAPHTFFEFRLDSLPRPREFLGELQAFLERHVHLMAIATCRRTAFGGAFAGSAEEQVDLLTRAAAAGCRLADIEVETAEELGSAALDRLRDTGAAVIVSWHDFTGTPDLEPVYQRLDASAPDLIKIVPFARTLRDSLRLLDLLEAHGRDGRLVAMSMGQRGVLTRVLGPRFGSLFTFAAPDTGEGTAPGQEAISTLRDRYRVAGITPATALYAVAGDPIGASLSPLMHNAAFRAAELDAVYLPLETADAAELREVADRLHLRGLSITMPLKEGVLPLLTSRSPAVVKMAACNTLVRQPDDTWHGDNTDVAGIVDPLEQRMPLASKRVLVLGAGGAARAAVFGLRSRGAEVYLLSRTTERAEVLAREAGAHLIVREQLAGQHFDIVINSTPYGMRGKDVEPPMMAAEMNCRLFFDLVYNPLETPLIRMAKERGIPVIAGVEMFAAQGVRQFELWTGAAAPVEAMLAAVTKALRAADECAAFTFIKGSSS